MPKLSRKESKCANSKHKPTKVQVIKFVFIDWPGSLYLSNKNRYTEEIPHRCNKKFWAKIKTFFLDFPGKHVRKVRCRLLSETFRTFSKTWFCSTCKPGSSLTAWGHQRSRTNESGAQILTFTVRKCDTGATKSRKTNPALQKTNKNKKTRHLRICNCGKKKHNGKCRTNKKKNHNINILLCTGTCVWLQTTMTAREPNDKPALWNIRHQHKLRPLESRQRGWWPHKSPDPQNKQNEEMQLPDG